MQELEEVLKKATLRPWANDRGTLKSIAKPGGLPAQVIAEFHSYDRATNKLGGAERDNNAALANHAVNNLEGLLKAVKLARYWMHQPTGAVTDDQAFLRDTAAVNKTIRQAEKVA